jgi:hypothetical protein
MFSAIMNAFGRYLNFLPVNFFKTYLMKRPLMGFEAEIIIINMKFLSPPEKMVGDNGSFD